MIKLITLGIAICCITGCIYRPQVTLQPVINDRYTIQAEARSAKQADRAAFKRARKICNKQYKQLMVLERETQLKGLGKILGPLSVTVENTFRQRSSVKRTPKRYDWYQATIRFYCVAPQPEPDLEPIEHDSQALG